LQSFTLGEEKVGIWHRRSTKYLEHFSKNSSHTPFMAKASTIGTSKCQITYANQIMPRAKQKKPVEFYRTLLEDFN
jgi:hypothetical protein